MKPTVILSLITAMFFLLVIGQQCSNDIKLKQAPNVNLLAGVDGNPYELPRGQFVVPRRYIFMLDMSHSMISGTCAQDIDGGTLNQNEPSANPFVLYDPNFANGGGYNSTNGSPTDQRASGMDCVVQPSRAVNAPSYPNYFTNPTNISLLTGNWGGGSNFMTPFLTAAGADYAVSGVANRIQMIYNAIASIVKQNGNSTASNIKVLIVPVTGGLNQQVLENLLPPNPSAPNGGLNFMNLNDVDASGNLLWQSTLTALNTIQADNQLAATAISDLTQDGTTLYPNGTPFPYRYKDTTMGTTDLGSFLKRLYTFIYNDMYNNQSYYPEYQIIHVTDGYLSPIQKYFQTVFNMFVPPNNASTCLLDNLRASDPTCTLLYQSMKNSWGDPVANSINQIGIYYGMIQSLPEYFGGGFARVDMVQLDPARVAALAPTGETNYISALMADQSARQRQYNWNQDMTKPTNPPFPLLDSNPFNYRITNTYIFNPNVRLNQHGTLSVDSAGDGSFDADKIAAGLDPYNPRSNGVCLNSIYLNPSYQSRCQELGQLLLNGSELGCDPQLDSDGDGLNECEEQIIGSDPYNFDSDGDSIPDFLEVVYGFNPNNSDGILDSNNDGVPNLINFASGLNPMALINQVPAEAKISYSVNDLGSGQTQILLHALPTLSGLKVSPVVQVNVSSWRTVKSAQGTNYSAFHQAPVLQMYSDRPHHHPIDYSQQLITYISDVNQNNILALIRTVNESDPGQVKWWIYKRPIIINNVITNAELSLSLFAPMYGVLDKGKN